MPEAIQVSVKEDEYLTWLLPLILAEKGGTVEEDYAVYISIIPIAHPQVGKILINDCFNYYMSYKYISSFAKLTHFLLFQSKGSHKWDKYVSISPEMPILCVPAFLSQMLLTCCKYVQV